MHANSNSNRRKSILVVDDDKMILDVLQKILSQTYHVEVAQDGAVAMEKMNQSEFSLIVSDVNMPVMDGISLYKFVMANSSRAAKKFLFFTGAPATEELAFFETNHLPYMLKPVSMSTIRHTVGKLVAAA